MGADESDEVTRRTQGRPAVALIALGLAFLLVIAFFLTQIEWPNILLLGYALVGPAAPEVFVILPLGGLLVVFLAVTRGRRSLSWLRATIGSAAGVDED
jgi:apolipoprotein N-acyltransferase